LRLLLRARSEPPPSVPPPNTLNEPPEQHPSAVDNASPPRPPHADGR
jgi:hypothetical protein